MKTRYRLTRRGIRGNAFYFIAWTPRLGSAPASAPTMKTPDTAGQIIAAKKQAERQPALNLQITRAYPCAPTFAAINRASL